MEIRIRVDKRWRTKEEELVRRIARIVYHSDEEVSLQDTGYKWSLNIQDNDWWCSGIGDNDEVLIGYRYSSMHLEAMQALHITLQWLLGDNS